MENNKFKVESLITDVELATESLGVILRDQKNTMFQFEDTDGLNRAYILEAYRNGATRNYTMIKILQEITGKLDELCSTYQTMMKER